MWGGIDGSCWFGDWRPDPLTSVGFGSYPVLPEEIHIALWLSICGRKRQMELEFIPVCIGDQAVMPLAICSPKKNAKSLEIIVDKLPPLGVQPFLCHLYSMAKLASCFPNWQGPGQGVCTQFESIGPKSSWEDAVGHTCNWSHDHKCCSIWEHQVLLQQWGKILFPWTEFLYLAFHIGANI